MTESEIKSQKNLPPYIHHELISSTTIQSIYIGLVGGQLYRCFTNRNLFNGKDLILGIGGGVFCTDFLSAIIHILTDIDESNAFRDKDTIANTHHYDTLNWSDVSLKDQIAAGSALCIPFFLPLQLMNDLCLKSKTVDIFLLAGYFCSALSVISHTLAHEQNHNVLFENSHPVIKRIVKPLVTFLQESRIFLHPNEHRKHHSNGHNTDFGVLNNLSACILNPLAEKYIKPSPLSKEEEQERSTYVVTRKQMLKEDKQDKQNTENEWSCSFWPF